MVTPVQKLAALTRVARLISDRECQQFSGLNRQVSMQRQQVAQLQDAAQACKCQPVPQSLADARIASAYSGRLAQELHCAEQTLAKMLPSFERARQKAARAAGRAEVLERLSAGAVAGSRHAQTQGRD